MNSKDRELVKQIFDENHSDSEDMEITEIEFQKFNFAINLINSFYVEIEQRNLSERPYFLSPPNNFSYMMN